MSTVETVKLAHRDFGGPESGEPVVLLHGLLGSSRNWQGLARILAESHQVTGLDLRNHGSSPHHPIMDYPSMAADVRAWLDGRTVHLVGHSMGGKVAMQLACETPVCIRSLTVVDIAPRAYPARWQREFAAMRRMPVERLASRAEAEAWLEEDIPDWAFRKFLVTNLERSNRTGFRWIINLAILETALPQLFQQVPKPGQRYDGPTLFVTGGRSRFVEAADHVHIRSIFTDCRIEAVPDAGHNVHFDQPLVMAALLNGHLTHAS
jgi:esterase